MTPEIEKRIKAVKAGRVPAGYKKTKIGIVPKEWDECKLSHYLSVSKEKNTELKYSKEDVFSISGELGIVNQIELLGRSYAGVSVAPYGVVKPNDVVYTKSPLKANPYGIIKTNKTGKTGIVSTLYAIFNCKDNVNSDFVQYYFESDKNLNDYLHPIVNIGAKHDMKISDENSLNGLVVFPPLSEQKKIAEILSAQDKIIDLKERLIAEKQRQKKHLMQMLLGEKTKKEKFALNDVVVDKKKWKRTQLGDIADIITGTTPDTSCSENYNGDILWCSPSDIEDTKYIQNTKITISELGLSKCRKVPQNAILVTCIGSTIGKMGIASRQMATNQQINSVVVLNDSHEFVFYSINYNFRFYEKYISAQAVPIISKNLFKQFTISLPSPSEQQAIAAVLSSADEEISLLQRDLEQEKLKKKSLMQLLLTGLVRVR